MVPVQYRRNITAIAWILCLLLTVTCRNRDIRQQEQYRQLSLIVPAAAMDRYDNYLVVFPFRCVGCVEHKLEAWIAETDSAGRAGTVIVYDTAWTLHGRLKAVPDLAAIHAGAADIERAFPRLANICVFKKDIQKGLLKEQVVNADDSSILFYLENL